MARTRASLIRSLTLSTAVAGLAGLPFVASAQQVDQVAIQEVIVTAQKRVANLQDVVLRIGNQPGPDPQFGRQPTSSTSPATSRGLPWPT